MATRKGINISGHYVVIDKCYCIFLFVNVLCILKN